MMMNPSEAYHTLADEAANVPAIQGVQRGLQGMHEGTGEDAEDAFASFEREIGIPAGA